MRPPRQYLLQILLLVTISCGNAAFAQEPSSRPEPEQSGKTEAVEASSPAEQTDKAAPPEPVERPDLAADPEKGEKPGEIESSDKAETPSLQEPAAQQVEKPAPAKDQAAPRQAETPTVEGTADTSGEAETTAQAASAPSLPADSVTHHTLELPGRTLRFEAVAGSIPLTGSEERVQARIAYVSYSLAGVDSRTRPVTFVFNGGPGSSSAWLHLGTLGPWRLPLAGENARPSAPGVSIPNADTWLDFSDLVMIDPVGTGYSRFESEPRQEAKAKPGAAKSAAKSAARKSGASQDVKKHYWSISGDADSIASFISKWTTQTGRHTSPKVLVGESYGGFRAPKIARELQSDYGVGVNLLVLVSPVLDYGFLRGQRHLPLNTVALLPSLSATALEARGQTPSSILMREAEDYARGQYLTDLMRGPRDADAVARVVKRITALTGLPAATVQQYGGRLDSYGYRREANAGSAQVASAYDATVKGLDPEPNSPSAHAQDPFVTALRAPLTSAMLDLYTTKLAWRPAGRYQLINGEVSGNWQYGNSPSPPQVVSDLKATLSLDARLRVLVAHGYTDLVTPYFASTLVLDQLPAYGDAHRVIQVTYPGGHMFYSRDSSRAAFREDVLIMLATSLNEEAATR